MSKIEKIIFRIFSDSSVTYDEAERILFFLDFSLRVKGSHHIFDKEGYPLNIAVKKRKELRHYQINDLRKILRDHGYGK